MTHQQEQDLWGNSEDRPPNSSIPLGPQQNVSITLSITVLLMATNCYNPAFSRTFEGQDLIHKARYKLWYLKAKALE
jgi:hypothetical protein